MWKSKTRLIVKSALFLTLTVPVFAKGVLRASSSGSFNLVETCTANNGGNCNSLLDMSHTNSPLTFQRQGSRSDSIRHSTMQYATEVNIWRGIRPLTSTRAQVEQILGPPINSRRQTLTYDNGTDKVDVVYSGSPCAQTEIGTWNVPKDTVLKIKVFPQRVLLIKTLKFDRSKYKRIREAHPENWVHYFNLDKGITIDTEIRGGREEVMSLVYEPSSKQKNLRCIDGARPL